MILNLNDKVTVWFQIEKSIPSLWKFLIFLKINILEAGYDLESPEKKLGKAKNLMWQRGGWIFSEICYHYIVNW